MQYTLIFPETHFSPMVAREVRTMQKQLSIYQETHPEFPAMDTAISHALLQTVSAGEVQQSLRIYQPRNLIAFGPQDTTDPGFIKAVKIGRSQGFECIRRLVGGRAAMFHNGTLAFGLTLTDHQPRENIEKNFQMMATLILRCLGRLGMEAKIGPVTGEYCPGKYSINSQGKFKLAGIGQRLARNATYIGGVICYQQNLIAEEILTKVYSTLNLDLNPNSLGNIQSVLPSVSYNLLEQAILDEFRTTFYLEEEKIPIEILQLALALEPQHVIQK